MNIDEAIEILEDTIKKLNGDMEIEHTNYNKAKAIETLINEYNNLKQIEESHRIENGKLREENKILEDGDMTQMYVNGYYDGEDKWKNKIKELVECYKYTKLDDYVAVIEFYSHIEELLKED